MLGIRQELVGQPVRSLQIMLRTIAQYDSEIAAVIPDGIYADDTRKSVESFQKRHGMPVTGVTDIDTWYAVADEYRRAVIELSPAEPVNPVLQPGQVIRAGERNEHLHMIHGMLRAIGARYASLPEVACNDIHDSNSVEAIRWLQRKAGIEASGDITRLTWKYLARLYRISVGDGTGERAGTRPAAE